MVLASSAGVYLRLTMRPRSIPTLPPAPFTAWQWTHCWVWKSLAPRVESPGTTGSSAELAANTETVNMTLRRMLTIGPRFSIIPKNAGPVPEELPVGLPVQFFYEAAGTHRALRSENPDNRVLRGGH